MSIVPKPTEFQQFIADARSEYGYTEDMPDILRKDHHYVFVYNERRGKHSNYLLTEEGAEFVSFAWTKSRIYEILKVETAARKYSLASVLGQDQILGELWLIPTEALLELDCDEANCFITKRFQTSIELPSGQTVPAWIYVGDSRFLERNKSITTTYTSCTYISGQRFVELHS